LGDRERVFFWVSFASVGCRIKSKQPYWLETHGHALGNRVAGWAGGALLLGGDRHLWGYPGPWSNPWVPKAQTRPLRAIAATDSVAYGLLSDGQIARFTGAWSPIEGSAAWGASELGITEDEHLLVIANGKLRVFDHGELRPLACDAINASAVAGTQGDDAFLLDQAGTLYLNADGRCDKVDAPSRLQRIAARSDRLLAVTVDGSVWRRRAGKWAHLPPPFKYRAGQAPAPMLAQDVGISAYSTWLVDTEGSVFLLSDES
jgi:hypothetical protein